MSEPRRKCHNCEHYVESYFSGYISSNCKIYGSLDVDQHERHPDTEATRCKDFELKKPKRPETEDDRVQRLVRSLWPNGYQEIRGGSHHGKKHQYRK